MKTTLGRPLRTVEDKHHWTDLWQRANANMPGHIHTPKKPSITALMLCLGYKIYGPVTGRAAARRKERIWLYRLKNTQLKNTKSRRCYNCAGNTYYNNMLRGSKPKGERAEMLEKLAGPYGQVLALTKLAQMGLAHKFVPINKE